MAVNIESVKSLRVLIKDLENHLKIKDHNIKCLKEKIAILEKENTLLKNKEGKYVSESDRNS